MFSNLVDVAKEIRTDLIEVYWILLVPLVCMLIAMEMFKSGDEPPQGGRILKRVVISVLLLLSFNEVVNVIGMLGDGIINKIDKLTSLGEVFKQLGPKEANLSNEWFNLREHILYVFSLIAYIIAYMGFFVAEALTQFVWIILYTVSPLMILAYIPPQTANVTKNLYQGLVKVIIWKILWTILGALLLKIAVEPQVTGLSDYIMSIVMNLCIGLSMLFIPMAARSLINDGMEGAASAMSAVPAMATSRAVKGISTMAARKTKEHGKSALAFTSRPARNLSQRGLRFAEKKSRFKNRVSEPIKESRDWYSDLGKNQARKRLDNVKQIRKQKNRRRYHAKNKYSHKK